MIFTRTTKEWLSAQRTKAHTQGSPDTEHIQCADCDYRVHIRASLFLSSELHKVVRTQWHIPWLVLVAWEKSMAASESTLWATLFLTHATSMQHPEVFGWRRKQALVLQTAESGAPAKSLWQTSSANLLIVKLLSDHLHPRCVSALLFSSSLVAHVFWFGTPAAADAGRLAVLWQRAGLLRCPPFGVTGTLMGTHFHF